MRPAVHRFAQQQEGDRTDDHRTRRNTLLQSFFQLGNHLGRVQPEPGAGEISGTR
ncbi:hypothetical protein I553_9316 [Mycobacterium xenopi 4042]|uniref:Uncharacterized protein n=1 Tax=Mycobacterium xenopi 4042 TaxID=1299334 RepID=X8E004_MYCXE|nr:hypothetical protein I553_9316 [Mycobacterium xenopi 4042]